MNTFLLKRFWLSLFITLLFACNSQISQPVALPSSTSEPTTTVIPTQTKSKPTQTPTIASTSTFTPLPPYATKQVLLLYNISGNHSPYDSFFSDFISTSSIVVLYTDGQIVIPGKPYQQKMLSTDEINQFVAQLEALDFFTIESNQQHDPTDKLYNFGDQYGKVFDGLWSCVLVNGDKSRKLCAYEPFGEFLVPEMKNILQFLDNFHPEGMSPYDPDRILLWVQSGRNPYDNDLPQNTIPWAESSLSLESTDEKIMYVDGETAKELYVLYGDEGHVFTQDGKEYTVYIQIVLPHEEITNQYQ